MFNARQGADREITLPCGWCIGCRVTRSRAWALRCVHEASLHEQNCFVTLTYADEHLPPHGSLRYRDFQLFMKRLRKRMNVPIRFFMCGEYGAKFSRPHYHACLFGVRFPDERPVSQLFQKGHIHYRSALLASLWGLGHVDITALNKTTANYASRYVLKKVVGERAKSHYVVTDADGVLHPIEPEFARMSLRPGIGADWLAKFGPDVWNRDVIVHDGSEYPVPKYYDRKLGETDPDRLAAIKEQREARALDFKPEQHYKRLAVREAVDKARLSQSKRSYEE